MGMVEQAVDRQPLVVNPLTKLSSECPLSLLCERRRKSAVTVENGFRPSIGRDDQTEAIERLRADSTVESRVLLVNVSGMTDTFCCSLASPLKWRAAVDTANALSEHPSGRATKASLS